MSWLQWMAPKVGLARRWSVHDRFKSRWELGWMLICKQWWLPSCSWQSIRGQVTRGVAMGSCPPHESSAMGYWCNWVLDNVHRYTSIQRCQTGHITSWSLRWRTANTRALSRGQTTARIDCDRQGGWRNRDGKSCINKTNSERGGR